MAKLSGPIVSLRRPVAAMLGLAFAGLTPVIGAAATGLAPSPAVAAVADPGPPPLPCSDANPWSRLRTSWPRVFEEDPDEQYPENQDESRPCYLAETSPYGWKFAYDGGPRRLDSGQSTTMSIEPHAPISEWDPIPRASWRLRFNASPSFPYDVSPFLRSATGRAANPTVGYDDVFLVDPVWDMSGCALPAEQPYRWMVHNCTVRMVRGPVYDLEPGEPIPWMVFAAAPEERVGSGRFDFPMMFDCYRTPCPNPPMWWGRANYMEMPVFLHPSPVAAFSVEQVGARTFRFDASGSLYNGTIDRYEWTFGDGATAAGRVVTHTFPVGENRYTPELAVHADGEVSRRSSSIDLTVRRSLSVASISTSPRVPEPGQDFTATYRVRNTGEVAMNDVTLTTSATPSTSVTKAGTTSPAGVTIAAGELALFTQRFRYVGGAGSISGRAQGTATDNGQRVGSNTRTYGVGDVTGGLTIAISAAPAQFDLDVDGRGEPVPQPFTATVVVTNTANERLNNVEVAPLTRSTSDDPGPVGEDRSAGWPNGHLATLAPGASRTLVYRLNAAFAGEVSLRTAVSGATPSNRHFSASEETPVVVREDNPVAVTWSIDKRYDDPGDEAKTVAQVNPPDWGFKAKYTLNGACPADTRATWMVGDEHVGASPRGKCTVAFRRLDVDPYRLTVVVERGARQVGRKVEKIEPHDHLVMSLGDSLSSGEGVMENNDGWRHTPCHRSSLAGPAKAARTLEDQDPHSAITFVHLACSGAGVQEGLLGRYTGVTKKGNEPPQLERAKQLAGRRDIDAIVLSIGINDIGFGNTAEHCLNNAHCQDVPITVDGVTQPLATFLNSRANDMAMKYQALAAGLVAQGIDPGLINLVEYPDALHNKSGGWAHYRGTLGPFTVVELAADETEWLYPNFELRLGDAVGAAAATHGWSLVSGMFSAFERHGLDDGTPRRWFNTVGESLARQGTHDGALHPNDPGHATYGRIVAGHLATKLGIPAAQP